MPRLNAAEVDFRALFLADTPLMDVRAPVEYLQGAFPTSVNLPLMNDREREAVGICYKEEGPDEALRLGHKLVRDDVKAARLAAWTAFCHTHPTGYMYCFRGGQRSHITQAWLKEAGVDYPLIEGGYKALRRFLMEQTVEAAKLPMMLIGGNTGSGKTRLIKALPNGVDLEGAARHRGSSFGRMVAEQATQIGFENQLAVDLLKCLNRGLGSLVLEDEGRIIGSAHVPLELYQSMTEAKIAVIHDPVDVRLIRLREEYVDFMLDGFCKVYGEQHGWMQFADYLRHGLFGIRKRLGMTRFQEITELLESALVEHQQGQSADVHLRWLEPLLVEYYDPMYQYQLSKKADRIGFTGTYQEVEDFLRSNTAP